LNGNIFSIYPNPAMDFIDLKLELDNFSDINISISNMLGQILIMEEFYVKELYTQFNVEDYSNGLYLIKIKINDAILTKQLIIEK
jgi:hypothetical protein